MTRPDPLSVSQVSTAEDNGILLYNGDNDHIAVELYQGHVKVSYDPGNQPGNAIYRLVIGDQKAMEIEP